MSEARIGPGLDQARFWLEGFSDGEDGENVSEKDVPKRGEPSPDDSLVSCCKAVFGFIMGKLVPLSAGTLYMFGVWYLSFFCHLPRVAFGFSAAEDTAVSIAGCFGISFVLFQQMWMLFMMSIRWHALGCGKLGLLAPLPGIIRAIALLLVIVFARKLTNFWMVQASIYGIGWAMAHVFFVIFFLGVAQGPFHSPYLWGIVEAFKGLGGCLGAILRSTMDSYYISLEVFVLVISFSVVLVLDIVQSVLRQSNSSAMEDRYWYTILSRVIMSRSFWSLTCYCVFCSGPFLGVSYWWCSVYLMDIYGLDDSSNNETVAFLWVGVIVGSIVFPHLFLVIRPTKWIPFVMSLVAFVSSLCITVIPCWRMRWEYFVTLLFVLGMTAGSCRSVVYPLYLDRFGVVASCFALSLTTSLTVLSGFVYHLMSYWLLSLYASKAKSGSSVTTHNVYQLSVWLLCVICFGLSCFAIFWVSEPSSKR